MRRWLQKGAILGAIALVGGLLATPGAEAYGRGHGRAGVFVGGGFRGPVFWPAFGFGFGPYWGWGPYWGPYWGYPGYSYGPPGGVDMNYAMMAGFGAVDLKVKPNQAEVWVDGKYFGQAKDLDGYPSYLWLEKGPHQLVIYKGGYRSFEEDIEVARGMKRELKVRLEPGESQPPGKRPTPAEKKSSY